MKLCRYKDNDQSKYMTIDNTPVDVAMTKEKMVHCFIYILRKKENIIKTRKKVCIFKMILKLLLHGDIF